MSKPEWNEDTPEWANYLVQDKSGKWVWFQNAPEPVQNYGYWRIGRDGGLFQIHDKPKENPDWLGTMEKRP